MAFDIDNIADAVLVIAERRETTRNDVEAICRAYNMEAGDLLAVLGHLNWQRVTSKDAMLSGVVVGLALARGDTPSEDALRADWVSWRDLREAVLNARRSYPNAPPNRVNSHHRGPRNCGGGK